MPARRIAGTVAGHVLAAIGVAIAVATLAFIAVQAAPGDVAFRIAEARYGERISLQTVDRARQATGLDQPIIVQYGRWVGSAMTGQLGRSMVSGRQVATEVWRSFQTTLSIAVVGVSLALVASLAIGFAAGMRRDGLVDRIFLVVSAVLSSVPSFLLGIILITIFAIGLRWLPAAGNNRPGYFILPACTLALALLPDLSRVARNAVVRTMQDFYPTYGRIKGQSWLRIVFAHALRPTLVPVIAYFGPLVAHTIGGLVVIDVLFNLDGLGTRLIDSVLAADIPMAMGAGLLIGISVVVVNGIADIAVQVLDPRLFNAQPRP
ncbi:ABC transporter permease [Chelatococcus asaccharovorans]|uniref:Peptide/nickel transport system permease protein n=1 Tax=Chelatococcus asaccharovorans TaxID=28210 RepID=A0A2V3U6G2_9HYPH|nr:ABC transporter permease [Chelatococcus asaccharovorans]MBS7705669.1 ABC transporter permease [Chelatococcus asaccharovorans]PXW58687.1 peptide/nickel transport system permease protein [Chelatococcus asaccharovorans]